MRIKLSALAILLGVSTLLGACQDSTSESPSPDAAGDPPAEASPEESSE